MTQATKTKPTAPEALILDIATRHFSSRRWKPGTATGWISTM